jgi:ubiquinone/menaquinone biosynthesis C-methylase UbiE
VSDQWGALAPRWESGRELLWRGTRPVSEWLVARLDPQPGQTILELAAGTGETGLLAAPLLGPEGRLISSDREPGMVDAARRLAGEQGIANADFRVLDADRIDLPDSSVDAVLNRFGYILRGDPPPALAEIRRVLRPGGRVAFSVWAERSRNPWMTVPAEVMVERGHLEPPTGEAIRLAAKRNPETIARLLAEAGFGEPEIEELEVAYRFADADELWFFVSQLRGPVALALAGLPESERREVRAAIEERSATAAGGFELGGISLNVAAR